MPHITHPGKSPLDVWRSAIAAAFATLIYLLSLAPTVTAEDSGELAGAAATWGVPHPPGFPLWVLLVRAAIALAPMPPALTANAMSAVFAAATVFVVAETARALGASGWAASCGALLLGFGPTFWSQSVIAEVYTLNTLLLACMLWCVMRWRRAPPETSARWLRTTALLFGLALANHHPLTLLAAPAFAIYVALAPGRTAHLRRWPAAVGCALLPLCLYAYIIIAARQEPLVNWGQAQDLGALWAHISRASYTSLELKQVVTWQDKQAFLAHFLALWSAEFIWWPALLAIIAATLWLRREALRELLLLLLIALCNSVVLLAILRFRFTAENIMRVNEYFLPTYMVTGLFIALLLQSLSNRLPGHLRPVIGAALLAFPALAVGLRFEQQDMSNYYLADDYSRWTLNSLPADAVYFPSGDYITFPSLYLQAAEGLRSDVLLANYTGEPSPRYREYVQGLVPSTTGLDPAQLQQRLIELSNRPILFAAKADVRIPGLRLEPWGLVYRAWRDNEARQPPPELDGAEILRNLSEATREDDLGRAIIADYYRALAENLATTGQTDRAKQALSKATEYCATAKKGLNNLGNLAAEQAWHEEALSLYSGAAKLDPLYVTPRRNKAMLLDRLGHRPEAALAFADLVRAAPEDKGAADRLEALQRAPTEAEQRIEQFRAALRSQPTRAPLWNNLGTAYAQAGLYTPALQAYQEAVRLEPTYHLAHRHLAALYSEVFHNQAAAAHHQQLSRPPAASAERDQHEVLPPR